MDPNAPMAGYAVEPLDPRENAYRLVAALFDPAVRDYAARTPRGSLELHWDAAQDRVVVVLKHTSKYVLKLGAPIARPR